jgi:hypothetical protein
VASDGHRGTSQRTRGHLGSTDKELEVAKRFLDARSREEAEGLYEFEIILREMGLSDFVYDQEEDLFRCKDGRFAFSRERADTKLLWERNHNA